MPRLIGLPTASSWAYLAQVYLSKKEIPLLPVLNGPLIFLVNEEERLEEISSAFSALIPLFPNNAKLISAIFGEDHPQRLKNLSLINSDTSLFVLNLKALESKVPSPQSIAPLRENFGRTILIMAWNQPGRFRKRRERLGLLK